MSDTPVSPAPFFFSPEEENNQIINSALEFAHDANEGYVGSRVVTDGVVLELVKRSLDSVDNQSFSVRKHAVITSLSHFISLLQKNKVVTSFAANTDLLPVAHPQSTQEHTLSSREFYAARARWIADDPSIHDSEVRSMVASMVVAPEGSAEREYYRIRLENLPQGEVPVQALLAAMMPGANNYYWMRQRRDDGGRFANEFGGLSAFVRLASGAARRLSGRTVGAGPDYFDMEPEPGLLARVPAAATKASKAYLPSPDADRGISPVEARTQAGDTIIDINDVQYRDAPGEFKEVTDWSPSQEEKDYYGEEADFGKVYSDGNYEIRKFDSGQSPVARDNFQLAQEAEKSGGPIVTNGGSEDGSLNSDQPVMFARRLDDSENPNIFAAGQSWSDTMADIRADEQRYEKKQAPDPQTLRGRDVEAPESEEPVSDPVEPDVSDFLDERPRERVEPSAPAARKIQEQRDQELLDAARRGDLVDPGPGPGLRIPLPGPWNPRIPGTGRGFRPRRPRPGRVSPAGTGRRWGTRGPAQGHAPYPIPGRRVYPGEIADMRIGSEMEQYVGSFLDILLGRTEKRQLRKVGSDRWVDLKTGETYTNGEVSNLAATSGANRSPFMGLATGPEVRAGTFVNKMSGSLFKELPVGSELNDHLRPLNIMTQFRKVGYNQWKRWDGKIFTDEEAQNYSKTSTMQIDRIGEFSSGAPSDRGRKEAPAQPRLPRSLTSEEFGQLSPSSVVSVTGSDGEKRYFQKTGEDSWKEINPDNSLSDPLVPFTNDDLLNMDGDLSLEQDPKPEKLPEPGVSPAQLAPDDLENLPAGTVVGIPEELIDAYAPPRREGQSEEDYQRALEEAKEYFRQNQWRKQGPDVWTNEAGDVRTDAEIADLDKTPGQIMSLGDEFPATENFYKIDKEIPYTPQGVVEGQTSSDYTDDPVELAQRFDADTLKEALNRALRNKETGYASLPFDDGDEPVPAEALYSALVKKVGIAEADKFVGDVYAEGRPFVASRDVVREFPGIESDDPEERREALIAAWNSQWGRSKFALDNEGNFVTIGEDADSQATDYLKDAILSEEWGKEFFDEFLQEYDYVLQDKRRDYTQALLNSLFQQYPGLKSENPEERKAAILQALEERLTKDEYEEEDGEVVAVNPQNVENRYLWDQAQEFIGQTDAPKAGLPTKKLPAAIEGATDAERAEFEKTGDYRRFLTENPESFDNVWNRLYNPTPEPYDPESGPPEANPVNLARRFTAEELKQQLREAILNNNGAGRLGFQSPSGDEVEFPVPAEALRDALQLQGEDTTEFTQNIFNENPSPARRTQQLLDEIADLTAQREAETNPTEKGKLTREINKKITEIGPRYKAMQALRNREGQLDRLSRRRDLTDEQRNQVNEKLDQVRSRLVDIENTFNDDLQGGQNITPFDESVDDELEKFDFEGRPARQAPEAEEAPTPAPTPEPTPEEAAPEETDKPAPIVKYKRVGDKVYIAQGKGQIIRNNPEFKDYIRNERGFVNDPSVSPRFEIAEMDDEEFREFMRTIRDRFGVDLQPEGNQSPIDFDAPATDAGDQVPNPSNNASGAKKPLSQAIAELEPVDSDGNKDTSKKGVLVYLAKIIAILDEQLANLNPDSDKYKSLEAWRKKYDSRAGRHGREKDIGSLGDDSRVVNVRPGDYRPDDVFVSDHFTITKVERSDVPYEEGDPYFGEQRITYTGYYPGGREETRSEVGRSEYYRTEAVYRGVTPPQPGENDPIPPPPNAVEYLPEGVPESELGPDGRSRSNIRQIKDKELNEIEGGKTFYMPDAGQFPEENEKYMQDFNAWKERVIARKNLWSPDSAPDAEEAVPETRKPDTETAPQPEAAAPAPTKSARTVKSTRAGDLQPGDITVRENADGMFEIFVVENVELREDATPVDDTPAISARDREFYNETIERESALGEADSSEESKKQAYVNLEKEYRKEAREAGQLTGSNRNPEGEGDLFDRWKWLTNQRETILKNEALQIPSEASEPEPAPVTPAGPPKVVIKGYHPGHQSQERTWNPDTSIDYIRGEDSLPSSGGKDPVMSSSEISKLNASDEEKKQMRRDRAGTLAESSRGYLESVDLSGDTEALVEKPDTWRISNSIPGFLGKAIDLARGKNGKEIKEALKKERVVYFDYETTAARGFEERRVPSSPVQVAAVVRKNGEEVDRKVFYINPEGEKLGSFYYEKFPKTLFRKKAGKDEDSFPEGDKLAQLVDNEVTVYTKKDGKYVNDSDPSDVLTRDELKARSNHQLQLDEGGNIFLQSVGLRDSEGNALSDEFLSTVGVGVEQATKDIIDFIGEDAYLVAHNQDFDVNYLQTLADRFGIDFNYAGVIDTLAIARDTKQKGPGTGGNTLEEVAGRYGIERAPENWHDAEVDADVLPEILDNLLDDLSPNSRLFDFERRASEYNEAVQNFIDQLSRWRAQNNIPEPEWGTSSPANAQPVDSRPAALDLEDIEIVEAGANVESILGGKIDDSWAADDENTVALPAGAVSADDLVIGDLFATKDGSYNEFLHVQDLKLNKLISFRNVNTGQIFTAYAPNGSTVELGTNELPVRRRRELEGLSKGEVYSLIARNKRQKDLEMAVPQVRFRDPEDELISEIFNDFIQGKPVTPQPEEDVEINPQEVINFLEGNPTDGGRVTTEYHFDKNGVAVAVGDRVYFPKKDQFGVINDLPPQHTAGKYVYRNYVQLQLDGVADSKRVPADKLELVNPPVTEETQSLLEDVAATPKDAPAVDRMALVRKIDRLIPYVKEGPGSSKIGNNVKAAVRAYRKGDYETAEKAINAAKKSADALEKPRLSVQDLADLVQARLAGLRPLVQDPDADQETRRLYSQAVVLSNREARLELMRRIRTKSEPLLEELASLRAQLADETSPREIVKLNEQIIEKNIEIDKARKEFSDSRRNYAKALRRLDSLEDRLWSEMDKNRKFSRESRLAVKRFLDGEELLSRLDDPLASESLTGEYLIRLKKDAAAPDYTLKGSDLENVTDDAGNPLSKADIIRNINKSLREAGESGDIDKIFASARLLEKMARIRERQLDREQPNAKVVAPDGSIVKRKDAGKISKAQRFIGEVNHEDIPEDVDTPTAEIKDPFNKEEATEAEENLEKLDKSRRRGLFYTNAESLLPGDIVSVEDIPAGTVQKVKKNDDGSLKITVTQAARTRPAAFDGTTAKSAYEIGRVIPLNLDPDDEVLLLTRRGTAALPVAARELEGGLPREGTDYNEFEGFLEEDDSSEGPVEVEDDEDYLGMARPESSAKDEVTPTTEQASIMDALENPNSKKIKVMALAGTGKTTTLKMAAKKILKKDPKAKITVVMFNVALSEDTKKKMPKKGVEVIRSGQLANEALSQPLKDKRSGRNNKRLTAQQMAKELGITKPIKLRVQGEEKEFSPEDIAAVLKKAEKTFANSADDSVEAKHFDEKFEEIPEEIVALAQKHFDEATNPNGAIPIEHHHVVKLWSLSSPDLTKRDGAQNQYLFYDEAQDVNPVVEKVIDVQNNFNKVVVVGDSAQAIYQFTGAVDSLGNFDADETLTLTESFRFGPEIAGFANRFLAFMGNPLRLKGSGPSGEIVEEIENPDIVISRTNGGGLSGLARLLQKEKQVAIEAEVWSEYSKIISGINGLRARVNNPGLKLSNLHPDLEGYNDIQEVLKAKKDGLLSGNVGSIINVLNRVGKNDDENLEGERDTDVLRNLLNRFQLVKDINKAKLSRDYTPIPYDDIKRGSIHVMNDESDSARDAESFGWTDSAGNMYFTTIRRNFRSSKASKEQELIDSYFRSRGFERKIAEEVDMPAGLGRVWDKNAVWVIPRSADNDLNLPPESEEQDTIPFFRMFNEVRKFANNYFATDETPISFTTAHKAKGREWDSVQILEDFPEPEVNKETLELEYPEEAELNLAYVAATRARKVLAPGNLEWVFDETSAADEEYNLPTEQEQDLNMAIPKQKVSRLRWVESVEEADKALTDQTNRVLEALKKAVADDSTPPWLEPWKAQGSDSQLPISVTTGKPYEGTNLIYLQAVAKNNNWTDNRWITQAEIDNRGGTVRGGQRPTRMTAWLPNYTTVTDDNGNELETVYSVSPVDHFVYNAEQVNGLNLGDTPRARPSTVSEAENILFDSYPDIPAIESRDLTPKEQREGLATARYATNADTIVLPKREDFSSPEKYFEALAHELIHSTGSRNRLNRDSVVNVNSGEFSLKAREEMRVEEEFIAQIGMAILASRLGVNLDIPNTAAYMKEWRNVFGDDANRLTRAAKRAQDAADYILRGRSTPGSPDVVTPESSRELVDAGDTFNMALPEEPTTPQSFRNEVSETKNKTQEISEKVTAMVVEAIERGEELPWNKPWTSDNIFSTPHSVTTNKPYRGFNIFILWATAMSNGWEDNRWITFNEAKKRGGFVKKGSKGTQIVNWSPVKKKVEQEDGSLQEEVIFMKPTVHTVFNVEQTEGVQDLPEPELMEPVPVLEAESAVLERYTDAPPITNKLQDAAFWRPSTDEITMPLREQFSDVGEYIATLFHELTHSTGHESRLNRKDLGDKYSTHLDARGEEELIAEMGSALLAARMGVDIDLTRTAGYAQSWLRPLQNNPEMIAKAAQQAQAAVDYMLGENKPNVGSAGVAGEERAAEIMDSRLNLDAPGPYIGDYGIAAADLMRRENEGENS